MWGSPDNGGREGEMGSWSSMARFCWHDIGGRWEVEKRGKGVTMVAGQIFDIKGVLDRVVNNFVWLFASGEGVYQ